MIAAGTFNMAAHDKWREALSTRCPVLVHLNADTTWLIQLPYPPSSKTREGRTHFNILLDPWLQGPQADVASWFSKQWHVVPSSVKTLGELNGILANLEGNGGEADAASFLDLVAISHEFTDHCHEATLRELPPSTPVFATDKAAKLIREWRHFDKVTTTPGFSGETSNWRPLLSLTGLPSWVGIGRVITPGNSLYYHSAVMIVFDLGSGRPETILYSPHGIEATDLSSVRLSGIRTLALLHGLHDVGIWMTKQLNLGALNGIQAVAESGAKYWIATHDEVKKGGGMIAPFLRRTKYSLKDAVTAEEKRMDGKVPEYEFVELGSGDGVVLA